MALGNVINSITENKIIAIRESLKKDPIARDNDRVVVIEENKNDEKN